MGDVKRSEMIALVLTLVCIVLGFGFLAWKLDWFGSEEDSDEFDGSFDPSSGGLDQLREMNKPPTAEECDFYGGKTDRYTWTQNNHEVEMRFPVNSGTTTKDIQYKIRADYIELVIKGEPMLKGALYARVVVDDCIWTFDHDEDGQKALVWNLHKKEATEDRGHWKCVAEGEPKIDTSRFGGKVQTVNANDPESIAKMVAQMR